MSNENFIDGLMGALLSGAQVVHIEPREGQSIEDAIAEFQAAHRAECPGCAAEYAAEQKEVELAKGKAAFDATQRDAGMNPNMTATYGEPRDLIRAARDAAKHEYEAKEKAYQADLKAHEQPKKVAAVVTHNIGQDKFIIQVPPASDVKVGTDLNIVSDVARNPIGYMVFAMNDGKMTPVRGSFETDREVVVKKLTAFNAMPQIEMLVGLAKMAGRDLMEAHEIRPVYAD